MQRRLLLSIRVFSAAALPAWILLSARYCIANRMLCWILLPKGPAGYPDCMHERQLLSCWFVRAQAVCSWVVLSNFILGSDSVSSGLLLPEPCRDVSLPCWSVLCSWHLAGCPMPHNLLLSRELDPFEPLRRGLYLPCPVQTNAVPIWGLLSCRFNGCNSVSGRILLPAWLLKPYLV